MTEPDDITTDMTALATEITDACVLMIVSRIKEAGYTYDDQSLPIMSTVALDIINRIGDAGDVAVPGFRRRIAWLIMKRIKETML